MSCGPDEEIDLVQLVRDLNRGWSGRSLEAQNSVRHLGIELERTLRNAAPGERVAFDLNHIREFEREELQHFRARHGAFALEIVYEQMGRSVVEPTWRDDEEVDLHVNVGGDPYFDWAFDQYGRSPSTIRLLVPAEVDVGEPRFEFERPPQAVKLRTPALYVQELEQRPRPPGLVPGWMKVELAVVGAWDLRADVPTWQDFEPTGVPQTPESVGVEPPPGAEWALGRGAAR